MPGYRHVDGTYLTKFEVVKQYLFVASDRATRLILYWILDSKTDENREDSLNRGKGFFPFKITHIVPDNGLEFTYALLKSKN